MYKETNYCLIFRSRREREREKRKWENRDRQHIWGGGVDKEFGSGEGKVV
jgi:hypothetical protein